ncbi:hypothetical protein [Enterovirga sp. CN4-39]|uniref:hypothetical protein n=1 Tax=Enterovirga sp. CN4-39 TaxID=3400910 RepID=UPI003C0CFA16
MTGRRYRANLPAPEDTTLSGSTPLLTPGFLRFVGELLFGERWQTPLATYLGDFRGRPVNPAVIHHWTTATRSVPDWVAGALVAALEDRRTDWQQRAQTAREVADRIRSGHGSGPLRS